MSLLEFIAPEMEQKNERISKEIDGFNPYLVDVEEYFKNHEDPLIKPRPEIYSFETVSNIPEMVWIKNTNLCYYAPSSENMEVQKEQLREFLNQLLNESIRYPSSILPEYFKHTEPMPLIAYDLETTGLDTRVVYHNGRIDPKCVIVGVSLATSENRAYYMPVNHNGLDGIPNWSMEVIIPFLSEIHKQFITVYHNAQYDREVSAINGVVIEQNQKFMDTFIMAHLYDAASKSNGLKHLAQTLLNRPMIETAELFPKTYKNLGFHQLSVADAYVYASLDTMNTYALFLYFLNTPKNNVFREQSVSLTIDFKMIDVLRSMYRVSMPLNVDFCILAALDTLQRIELMEKELENFLGRKENLNSSTVLQKIIFEEFHIPTEGLEKTKTGYKLDEDTLFMLADKYPEYTILKHIVKLRKMNNSLVKYWVKAINNSYCCEAMPFLKGQVQYSLTTVPTGRLSSSSTSGRPGVTVNTSPKGKISYSKHSGAFTVGLNTQGLDSRGFSLEEVNICDELPSEARLDDVRNPSSYMNDLIRVCSEEKK